MRRDSSILVLDSLRERVGDKKPPPAGAAGGPSPYGGVLASRCTSTDFDRVLLLVYDMARAPAAAETGMNSATGVHSGGEALRERVVAAARASGLIDHFAAAVGAPDAGPGGDPAPGSDVSSLLPSVELDKARVEALLAGGAAAEAGGRCADRRADGLRQASAYAAHALGSHSTRARWGAPPPPGHAASGPAASNATSFRSALREAAKDSQFLLPGVLQLCTLDDLLRQLADACGDVPKASLEEAVPGDEGQTTGEGTAAEWGAEGAAGEEKTSTAKGEACGGEQQEHKEEGDADSMPRRRERLLSRLLAFFAELHALDAARHAAAHPLDRFPSTYTHFSDFWTGGVHGRLRSFRNHFFGPSEEALALALDCARPVSSSASMWRKDLLQVDMGTEDDSVRSVTSTTPAADYLRRTAKASTRTLKRFRVCILIHALVTVLVAALGCMGIVLMSTKAGRVAVDAGLERNLETTALLMQSRYRRGFATANAALRVPDSAVQRGVVAGGNLTALNTAATHDRLLCDALVVARRELQATVEGVFVASDDGGYVACLTGEDSALRVAARDASTSGCYREYPYDSATHRRRTDSAPLAEDCVWSAVEQPWWQGGQRSVAAGKHPNFLRYRAQMFPPAPLVPSSGALGGGVPYFALSVPTSSSATVLAGAFSRASHVRDALSGINVGSETLDKGSAPSDALVAVVDGENRIVSARAAASVPMPGSADGSTSLAESELEVARLVAEQLPAQGVNVSAKVTSVSVSDLSPATPANGLPRDKQVAFVVLPPVPELLQMGVTWRTVVAVPAEEMLRWEWRPVWASLGLSLCFAAATAAAFIYFSHDVNRRVQQMRAARTRASKEEQEDLRARADADSRGPSGSQVAHEKGAVDGPTDVAATPPASPSTASDSSDDGRTSEGAGMFGSTGGGSSLLVAQRKKEEEEKEGVFDTTWLLNVLALTTLLYLVSVYVAFTSSMTNQVELMTGSSVELFSGIAELNGFNLVQPIGYAIFAFASAQARGDRDTLFRGTYRDEQGMLGALRQRYDMVSALNEDGVYQLFAFSATDVGTSQFVFANKNAFDASLTDVSLSDPDTQNTSDPHLAGFPGDWLGRTTFTDPTLTPFDVAGRPWYQRGLTLTEQPDSSDPYQYFLGSGKATFGVSHLFRTDHDFVVTGDAVLSELNAAFLRLEIDPEEMGVLFMHSGGLHGPLLASSDPNTFTEKPISCDSLPRVESSASDTLRVAHTELQRQHGGKSLEELTELGTFAFGYGLDRSRGRFSVVRTSTGSLRWLVGMSMKDSFFRGPAVEWERITLLIAVGITTLVMTMSAIIFAYVRRVIDEVALSDEKLVQEDADQNVVAQLLAGPTPAPWAVQQVLNTAVRWVQTRYSFPHDTPQAVARRAKWIVLSALRDQDTDRVLYLQRMGASKRLRLFHLTASPAYDLAVLAVISVLMALAFVEAPPSAAFAETARLIIIGMQGACLALLAADVAIAGAVGGWRHWVLDKERDIQSGDGLVFAGVNRTLVLQAVLLVAMTADWVVLLLMGYETGADKLLPYTALLRPAYLAARMAGTRQAVGGFWRTLYHAKSTLLLIFVFLSVTAVVSMLLLGGTMEVEGPGRGLDTFPDAFITLFTYVFTSDNFGVYWAVSDPAKTGSMYLLYRVLYSFITAMAIFLLISLVIADFETRFTSDSEANDLRAAVRRRERLITAFAVLDDDGNGALDCDEAVHFLRLCGLPLERSDIGQTTITCRQFVMSLEHMSSILQKGGYRLRGKRREAQGGAGAGGGAGGDAPAVEASPALAQRVRAMCASLHKNHGDRLRNGLFVLITLHLCACMLLGTQLSSSMESAMVTFNVVYWFDILTDIAGHGWTLYTQEDRGPFSAAARRFDFTVVATASAGLVAEGIARSVLVYDPGAIYRLLLALPALRIFSVPEGNRILVFGLGAMLPAFSALFGVGVCVMYLFATVGVFLFDGLLSDLPERLYGAAKTTNFDSFDNALGLLMQLTVGGLDDVVKAMVLSQTSLFPVLYLMAFVTIMVVFILNVLIGVVISAFRAIEDTTVDTEVEDVVRPFVKMITERARQRAKGKELEALDE